MARRLQRWSTMRQRVVRAYIDGAGGAGGGADGFSDRAVYFMGIERTTVLRC